MDSATGMKFRPFDRSCDSRERRERERDAVRKLLVDTGSKTSSPAALRMHEAGRRSLHESEATGRMGRRKQIWGKGKAGSVTSRAAAEFEKIPHKE